MFIYTARGGASVLTKIQAHPFTDTRVTFRKSIVPVEAVHGAHLPEKLTKKIATLKDENDLQGDDKASISIIAEESTYLSITSKTEYFLRDLGAPSHCTIITAPKWAPFNCPITKGKINCAEPDPQYKSKLNRLGAFLKGSEAQTELNRDEGMVVHDFRTTGCATDRRNNEEYWERVVPSPYDEDPQLKDDTRLATMPFLWLRRRFSGGTLESQKQLHCAPLAPNAELKPVHEVKDMKADPHAECYQQQHKK